MKTEGIDHVALSVHDLGKATEWYQRVLGLERRHADVWGDEPTFVCAGQTGVALFSADNSAPRFLHLAFRVDRQGFESAQRELRALGVEFRFQDHEISHSIYFTDPDGHRLEITTYDL